MAVAKEDGHGYELVPAERPVTIRHLLTHTAGMSFGPKNVAAAARRPALNGPRISVSELIPDYAKAPLGFQPGTAWQYSPAMGFDVVARLVEVLSGADNPTTFEKPASQAAGTRPMPSASAHLPHAAPLGTFVAGLPSGPPPSAHRERVGHRQVRKSREVAIRGPEHPHAVVQAKRRNPGVVHYRPLQERRSGDALEGAQVAFPLGQEAAAETVEEPGYGIEGHIHRRGIPEDPRVRDDREKLVGAWPGNRHGFRSAHRTGQHLAGALVEGHFRAMRIDEQVRVDSYHAPCSR